MPATPTARAVFGQLFHPGREIMESQDGSAPVAYSASAVPTERFHVTPVSAQPAADRRDRRRLRQRCRAAAGGRPGRRRDRRQPRIPARPVPEPARQPARRRRTAAATSNRLRFLREVIAAVRAAVGREFVVGLRISGDELSHDGLRPDEVVGGLLGAGRRRRPRLRQRDRRLLGHARRVGAHRPADDGGERLHGAARGRRQAGGVGAGAGGRAHQPAAGGGAGARVGAGRRVRHDSRADLRPRSAGQGDAGRLDEIRACVACNQACIGHFHMGYPISCIQHPETGRELRHGRRTATSRPRKVLVVGRRPGRAEGRGGGCRARPRGHAATRRRRGSAARCASPSCCPAAREFGGIVANLAGEAERAGARIVTGAPVDPALVQARAARRGGARHGRAAETAAVRDGGHAAACSTPGRC